MNYGPQSSDPWNWDLGGEDNSVNNGGMNPHGTTKGQRDPYGWSQRAPQSAPHHPNGSIPHHQGPRHQHVEQQHYNDPNVFSGEKNHNGAAFFDSFVNSNAGSWGQQNVWNVQNHQPSMLPDSHVEAENNEVVSPEVDFNRTSSNTGYVNVHPEKNANFHSGDNANANVAGNPMMVLHAQTHSRHGSAEVQDVMSSQSWGGWDDTPSSKEPTPPPVSFGAPPEGHHNDPNHHGLSFIPPPPLATQNVPFSQATRPEMPSRAQLSDQQVSQSTPEIKPNQLHQTSPQNVQYPPPPLSEATSVKSHQPPSSSPQNLLGFAQTTSEEVTPLNPYQPMTTDSSNQLASASQQHSTQKQHSVESNNSTFVQEIPTPAQRSTFVPSEPWNVQNVHRNYRLPQPIPENDLVIKAQLHLGAQQSLASGIEYQNQAFPPPMEPKSKLQGRSSHGFSTPDSRSNNPFLTSSDDGVTLHPLGTSTPRMTSTTMPYKPENEEVPPKQDPLQQRMSNLTIEEAVDPQNFSKPPESTNQEALVGKEPQLLVSDRNQYLETGHLSAPRDNDESSLQDLADESDAPPPGLDRMVTGQLREPIASPSDVDIQSNAATVGSYILGVSSASSIASEGGRKAGSVEGEEDEPESQRLVQGESTTEEPSYTPGPAGHREVPGEAEPVRARIVLGQMGSSATPPSLLDQPSPRSEYTAITSESVDQEHTDVTNTRHPLSTPRHHSDSIQDGEGAMVLGLKEVVRVGERRAPRSSQQNGVSQHFLSALIYEESSGMSASPSSDIFRGLEDTKPAYDRGRSEQEIGERMVVGERTEPQQPNTQDDYRQPLRPRHRHPRGESSFDDEDRDYSSDRDRGRDRDRDRGEFKRDERPRRRRDERHRSPEYRSDDDYDDKRPYPKGTRERDRRERRDRDRDYSPDRDYYYRDYYQDRDRRPRRYDREREFHHRDREYYDDDYYYRDHRSRPSSRTGSDYRRLNVSADFAGRSRHYYPDSSMLMNSTMNSSGFPDLSKMTDPRSYAEYLETMRRVDPAGYAVWYNNYMATRYSIQQSINNDRASVHSGQSSSNQRPAVQSPSAAVEEDKEEDYTPRLYTTAHVRGKIDNYGRLLVVDPHYPMDGQRASISLFKLSALPLPDADMEEFLETPGPFIPGVTHYTTVLHYLKRMSQSSQKNSEKLLYDLVHLIVKGNGEINGCDISELLMNSFKKCTYEDDRRESVGDGAISQVEVITRFRELLIQGNKLEALEWAIENGSWGHALFLSSKMDLKTHKDVMFRFVDSISQNDPIRTLYQMMSGHIPHASECCGDKQWSDWRPHLAMILGNPTANSKIDRKSIIRLGDSLSAKGRIFAAHFCYLTAQVELTVYKPSAKLVLLGSNAKLEDPLQASCRAIMLTLCYEYGLKLKQRDFSIPSLQLFKLILTTRLIDIGKNKIALQYCQLMALEALQCGHYDRAQMGHVVDLASRLKMLEPSLALSGDIHAEPEWLEKLKAAYEGLPDDYEARVELRPSASSSTISEAGQDVVTEPLQPITEARNMMSISQPLYDPYAGYNAELTVTSDSLPKSSLPPQPQLVSEEREYNTGSFVNPPQIQNHYMEPPPLMSAPSYAPEPNYWENTGNPGMVTLDNNMNNNINSAYDQGNPEAPPTPIKTKSNDFFKATEEQLKDAGGVSSCSKALGDVSNKTSSGKPEPSNQQPTTGKPEDQKSGWFGGFLDKLSMRPKNQMKLPDDKNPSIVWDKDRKKWVNLDGETDAATQIKPPPKAFEMGGPMQPQPLPSESGPTFSTGPQLQNSGPTSLPPSNNKYKLQKGKLMKKNYVDIMSSSKDSTQSQPPSLDGYVPLIPPPSQQPTFFTPSRVEGIDNAPYDFITPSSNPRLPEGTDESAQPQLSRCSSVSSLSREVQFYMEPQGMRGNRFKAGAPQPMMYNRSQMQ